MPYLSLNIPPYEPLGLSPIEPSIAPPADSSLYTLSASSRLYVLTAIFDLFSFSFVLPMISGTSLAINTLFFPTGREMCIIFSIYIYSSLEMDTKMMHMFFVAVAELPFIKRADLFCN